MTTSELEEIREEIAVELLQGILANPNTNLYGISNDQERAVQVAISLTGELIRQLEKRKK